ncbi:MAG: DUF4252 domain-containing protein [Flammeovirgaceae bacterium]
MKKLSLLLVLLSWPLFASAQDAITKFYGKYAESEDFTTVYISNRMFQMFAGMTDDEDRELRAAIRDIGGLRILSTDSRDGQTLYREASNLIPSSEYEELMVVKEGKEQTRFMIKENKQGQIIELVMISGTDEGFTIMSFVGIINLEQISKMSSNMDIRGFEHLDDLEKQHRK